MNQESKRASIIDETEEPSVETLEYFARTIPDVTFSSKEVLYLIRRYREAEKSVELACAEAAKLCSTCIEKWCGAISGEDNDNEEKTK